MLSNILHNFREWLILRLGGQLKRTIEVRNVTVPYQKVISSITIAQDPANPEKFDDFIRSSLARGLISELESGGYITYTKRAGDIPGLETTTAIVNVVKTPDDLL